MGVKFSRPNHHGWKMVMVDGIGKVLCLQAEASPFRIRVSTFTHLILFVNFVAVIELDARKRGGNGHSPSGFWVV